jgi:hypothetical protein
MTKTFKEYLIEYDRSDIELQNQYRQQHQATAQDAAARTAFSSKMQGQTPVEGDIIQNKAGKFIVVKHHMNDRIVRKLGARGNEARDIKLPATAKFEPVGQQNGKNVFNLLPSS